MDCIGDVIARLLPKGTGSTQLEDAPIWPPDVFAVAATLINLSAMYAHPRYMAHHPNAGLFDSAYCEEVAAVGKEWADSGVPPQQVKRYWRQVIAASRMTIAGSEQGVNEWDAIFKLMAIADEAALAVGFALYETKITRIVLEELVQYCNTQAPPKALPYLPSSLCVSVPPDEACVLPKTRTPQVGCTLRALSHNLALLPSTYEVRSNWLIVDAEGSGRSAPLNVLVVPFPYTIGGRCFEGVTSKGSRRSVAGFLNLHQRWLDGVTAEDIAHKLLLPLIHDAEREVDCVHAVVFPEAALSEDRAQKVAGVLARNTSVEIFITGSMCPGEKGMPPRNVAHAELLRGDHRQTKWQQGKRHRWKVDARQMRKYHIGNVLDRKDAWWENIDVSERDCFFYVYRHGASLAVFVCEDLARVDAVQTVVRAIGPNLVIALLMDDVQIERRWPGRYATVLADDPGSAVLSVTSLGLVRRAQMPTMNGRDIIGLWKEPSGEAKELELKRGDHALLLTLSHVRETNYSADGRSDDNGSVSLALTGVAGIKVEHAPPWAQV